VSYVRKRRVNFFIECHLFQRIVKLVPFLKNNSYQAHIMSFSQNAVERKDRDGLVFSSVSTIFCQHKTA
jgi:hypothetical protein